MFALKLQGLSIIWCINRIERGEKTELYSETGAARVFLVKASYFLCSESSFRYFLGQSSIIRMNSPFSLSLSFPTHFIRSARFRFQMLCLVLIFYMPFLFSILWNMGPFLLICFLSGCGSFSTQYYLALLSLFFAQKNNQNKKTWWGPWDTIKDLW